jgi:monothiol glutaredoxin
VEDHPEVAIIMLSDALKARFDQEIHAHPIVIYMKGNALFPQCGFSARAVQLLAPLGPVHAVDVLADPAVREGIKAYSKWPTIPQVYIHGAFVGGSDIVADLAARGELKALVDQGPKKA